MAEPRTEILMAPNEQNPFAVFADIEARVQNFARQFAEIIDGLKRAFEPVP